MTTKFRFIILHLALLLLLVTGASSIFAIHSFGSAVPVTNGKAGQKSLPVTWEAAVPSHGKYYQWILKENHGLTYDCSYIFLALTIVGLVVVEKKIKLSQSDDSFGIEKYRYANLAVGVTLALFLYIGNLVFPSF